MTEDTPLEDISISTSFGNIDLPTQDFYDFIKRCIKLNKRNTDLVYSHIEDFFGEDRYETEFHALAPHEAGPYLKCFFDVLERDYNIVKTVDYHFKNQHEISPTYHEFDVGRKEKESLMVKGYVFAEDALGSKCVFHLSPFSDEFNIEFEVFYNPQNINFKKIWARVEDYFKTEGPMLGSKIDAKWKRIDFEERTWDSIVIADESKKMINRHIINFIEHIEEYKDKRLPTSRGILITGPPGTGKTLCCETIMNLVECTAIYVTSDVIDNVGQIKEIYKLARKLAPTLIVIEDIDTLGGLDRRDKGNHPLLGEFLNCLSGVGGNDGVITIATTNYPENLDVALADRPGRFDLRVEFGLPNAELRKHILEKYLKNVKCNKLKIDKIVKETENMSGAYLREVIMTAYMISLEEETEINQKILEEALKGVKDLKTKVAKSYGIRKETEEFYS